MALLMSHVPWIGELSRWIPVAKSVKKFRSYAVNCAIERKMHGSPRKDIFYHLVRFHFEDPIISAHCGSRLTRQD
jgi:hypothetical protein